MNLLLALKSLFGNDSNFGQINSVALNVFPGMASNCINVGDDAAVLPQRLQVIEYLSALSAIW